MNISEAAETLQKYLKDNGPQLLPPFFSSEEEKDLKKKDFFERIVESEAQNASIDYAEGIVFLEVTESKCLGIGRNGSQKSEVFSIMLKNLKLKLKDLDYPFLSRMNDEQLQQAIIDTIGRKGGMHIWGDRVFFDENHKPPSAEKYRSLVDLQSEIETETKPIRTKGTSELVKKNPMFFSMKRSRPVCNDRSFVFTCDNNDRLKPGLYCHHKSTISIAKSFAMTYIFQIMRRPSKEKMRRSPKGEFPLLQLLFHLNNKNTPAQAIVSNLLTIDDLKDFIQARYSKKIKVHKEEGILCASIKRNKKWDSLCSRVVEELQTYQNKIEAEKNKQQIEKPCERKIDSSNDECDETDFLTVSKKHSKRNGHKDSKNFKNSKGTKDAKSKSSHAVRNYDIAKHNSRKDLEIKERGKLNRSKGQNGLKPKTLPNKKKTCQKDTLSCFPDYKPRIPSSVLAATTDVKAVAKRNSDRFPGTPNTKTTSQHKNQSIPNLHSVNDICYSRKDSSFPNLAVANSVNKNVSSNRNEKYSSFPSAPCLNEPTHTASKFSWKTTRSSAYNADSSGKPDTSSYTNPQIPLSNSATRKPDTIVSNKAQVHFKPHCLVPSATISFDIQSQNHHNASSSFNAEQQSSLSNNTNLTASTSVIPSHSNIEVAKSNIFLESSTPESHHAQLHQSTKMENATSAKKITLPVAVSSQETTDTSNSVQESNSTQILNVIKQAFREKQRIHINVLYLRINQLSNKLFSSVRMLDITLQNNASFSKNDCWVEICS